MAPCSKSFLNVLAGACSSSLQKQYRQNWALDLRSWLLAPPHTFSQRSLAFPKHVRRSCTENYAWSRTQQHYLHETQQPTAPCCDHIMSHVTFLSSVVVQNDQLGLCVEQPCLTRARSVIGAVRIIAACKCTECRGVWHAIRDHIQRSYLIAWDAKADHLVYLKARGWTVDKAVQFGLFHDGSFGWRLETCDLCDFNEGDTQQYPALDLSSIRVSSNDLSQLGLKTTSVCVCVGNFSDPLKSMFDTILLGFEHSIRYSARNGTRSNLSKCRCSRSFTKFNCDSRRPWCLLHIPKQKNNLSLLLAAGMSKTLAMVPRLERCTSCDCLKINGDYKHLETSDQGESERSPN